MDVFFVVSGFVITSGLIREAEDTGTLSLVAFYRRRALRIVPTAMVVLAAILAAAALLPRVQRGSVDLDVLRAAAGLANLWQPSVASPVSHFWSLSVEEQFYLVWPLLLLLAWRLGRSRSRSRRFAFWVAVAASFASLSYAEWGGPAGSGGMYDSTLARGWELGAGVILAILAPRMQHMSGFRRLLLTVAGTSGVLIGAFTATTYPLPGAVLPVFGTSALIAAGSGGTSPLAEVLASRALRRVGDLSYSLYLWHFAALAFVRLVIPPAGLAVTAGALATSAVLAVLSHRFVEQPALRLQSRISRPSVEARPASAPEAVSSAS